MAKAGLCDTGEVCLPPARKVGHRCAVSLALTWSEQVSSRQM